MDDAGPRRVDAPGAGPQLKGVFMLCFRRRIGQAVCLSDDIVVHVTKIHGNSVTLGFEGPDWVRIVREEVAESPKGPRSLRNGDSLRDE